MVVVKFLKPFFDLILFLEKCNGCGGFFEAIFCPFLPSKSVMNPAVFFPSYVSRLIWFLPPLLNLILVECICKLL